MAVRRTDDTGSEPGRDGTNEVRIVGRVPAQPASRELPSGDAVITFRVVVARPERSRLGVKGASNGGANGALKGPANGAGGGSATAGARRHVGVDTIDCAAWTARTRKAAQRVAPGDTVEVTGALRRRFWRAAAGPASRTEVEVASLRVLSRVGA